MASLVLTLQEKALNPNTNVTEVLRLALATAKKLGLDDIGKWIDLELNGYKNADDLPEYRNVHAQLVP